MRRARHRALDHRVADGGLLARALLRDRRPVVAARAALVDALDRREQLRVHGLHRGAVDRLDGPLHLALVDLLQHVQGRVGDLRARRPLPVHFRARLRRRVRGGLLRRRLLLIVAVLVEHVIQVGTLRRVVDHLERLLDLSACEDGPLLAAGARAESARAVRLRVVAALALATCVLADEVVDADDLDLRVALARRGARLAHARPLEATIEDLLLTLELLLKLRHFCLLLI